MNRPRRSPAGATVLAWMTLGSGLAVVIPGAPASASVLTGAPEAVTYYLSASGRDDATGTSPQQAWRTLARADQQTYSPGDRLLLAGGQVFTGDLSLDAADAGTAAHPVKISSYGIGRATIDDPDPATSGILVDNAGGYDVGNLEVVGSGRATSTRPGVLFYSTANTTLNHVTIAAVTVSGFNQGIVVGTGAMTATYRDVVLTSDTATGNADAGIETFGAEAGALRNVRIIGVVASDNPGVPGKTRSTGNGIVLGEAADVVVESSVADHNGTLDTGTLPNGLTQGPAGIWAYDSTDVTLSHDESFDNSTANHVDGDGFDLDENVTDSVVEYNYSFGNAGAGFLLDGTVDGPNEHNTVRYNISDYDGWDNSYAGLQVIGSVSGADVYNNTVYVSPVQAPNSRPEAVRIDAGASTLAFRNNLLVTAGGLPLVEVISPTPGLTFQGNDYWSSGAPFEIVWGPRTYQNLAAWRAATGEERLGGRAVGLAVNPRVVDPAGSGIPRRALRGGPGTALELTSRSSLVGAGLDLGSSPFHLSVGAIDLWGHPLRLLGRYSIGADQVALPGPGSYATVPLGVAAGSLAALGLGAGAGQGLRRRRRERIQP